jgi:hypothetical protein
MKRLLLSTTSCLNRRPEDQPVPPSSVVVKTAREDDVMMWVVWVVWRKSVGVYARLTNAQNLAAVRGGRPKTKRQGRSVLGSATFVHERMVIHGMTVIHEMMVIHKTIKNIPIESDNFTMDLMITYTSKHIGNIGKCLCRPYRNISRDASEML